MRARRLIAAASVALAIGAAGCRKPSSDDGPPTAEAAALAVFELAREAEPSDAALAVWFEPARDARARAHLVDALAALRPLGAPRVVGVEPIGEGGGVAVDLVASLPAAGEARCAVELEGLPAGGFRVRAFSAPGVTWPPARGASGSGLTTSPAPGATVEAR